MRTLKNIGTRKDKTPIDLMVEEMSYRIVHEDMGKLLKAIDDMANVKPETYRGQYKKLPNAIYLKLSK